MPRLSTTVCLTVKKTFNTNFCSKFLIKSLPVIVGGGGGVIYLNDFPKLNNNFEKFPSLLKSYFLKLQSQAK